MSVVRKKIYAMDNCEYCALPLVFDTYSKCSHDCVYCYTKMSHCGLNLSEDTEANAGLQLASALSAQKETSVSKLINSKFPVRLGILADPFPEDERKKGVTLKALYELLFKKQKIIISTKSIIPVESDYFDLLRRNKELVVMKYSFSTFDDKLARKIEPGAPLPSERIDAMVKLGKVGVSTLLRIQPFIFGVSWNDRTFIALERLKGFCKRVTVELLRVNKTAKAYAQVIFDKLGISCEDYFQGIQDMESPFYGAHHWYHYDGDFLRQEYLKIRKKVNRYGMSFGICGLYDGLANVDLNEGAFCCQINDEQSFDKKALCTIKRREQAIDIVEQFDNVTLKEYYEKYADGTNNISFARYLRVRGELDNLLF